MKKQTIIEIRLVDVLTKRENTASVQKMILPKVYDDIDENGKSAIQSMYQYSHDALAKVDIDSEIKRVNARLKKLGDYSEEIEEKGYVIDGKGKNAKTLFAEDIAEEVEELNAKSTALCGAKDIVTARMEKSSYPYRPTFITLHLISAGYVKGGKINKKHLNRMQGLFDTVTRYHEKVLKDAKDMKDFRQDATTSVNTLLTISPLVTYTNTEGEKVNFPTVDYKSIPAYLWEALRACPIDSFKWAMQDDDIDEVSGKYCDIAGIEKRAKDVSRVIKDMMLPILHWQGVEAHFAEVEKEESGVLGGTI